MSESVTLGTILITYDLQDTGNPTTGVTVTGDMPLITKLGLLDLARDTFLNGAHDE